MTKFTLFQFICSQLAKPQPVRTHDLSGQTVVVVGANIGLGFEAAKHFARMGPKKLVLACRNRKKAEDALSILQQETGYKGGEVQIIDLADFASVKSFVEKFEREEERLDLLVANAAVATGDYEVTKDGYESSVGINHLATALLSILLLPKMIATSKYPLSTSAGRNPRIVIVSSEVHHWAQFDDAAVQSQNLLEKISEKEYCTPKMMRNRYPTSKLLNVLFTRAIASHLPSPSPVIIDTVNPGYCYSGLRRNIKGLMLVFDRLMELALARSTEVGSRQLVWAALEDGGKGDQAMHGQYVTDCHAEEPADYVLTNEELEKKIWNDTLRILTKVEPKVGEVVREYLSTTA